MKKVILSFALITCMQAIGKAQDSMVSKIDSPATKTALNPLLKKNAWFIELGGSGIGLTANYERFFSKKPGGLSLRAGMGGAVLFAGESVGFLSIPIGVSYNFPISKTKDHFLEVGGTYTFVTGGTIGEEDSGGHGYVISPQIGWRHINPKSGWMFRATLIPVFIAPGPDGGAVGPWAGFSFGKKF